MNWFETPDKQPREWIETVAQGTNNRIERIVSYGQTSPVGFWYDSPQDEFVLLLDGYGTVEFEDRTQVTLTSGDDLMIPKHRKHRVISTREEPPTIWLTVYGDWSGG